MSIFTGTLFPLLSRHWSPGGFDPRFWVMFGLTQWDIDDVYCVVDDFGNLIAVGHA